MQPAHRLQPCSRPLQWRFFAAPAAAQFNPFLPRGGPRLAPGDFQIMNDSAAKLNDASGPKVGQD